VEEFLFEVGDAHRAGDVMRAGDACGRCDDFDLRRGEKECGFLAGK